MGIINYLSVLLDTFMLLTTATALRTEVQCGGDGNQRFVDKSPFETTPRGEGGVQFPHSHVGCPLLECAHHIIFSSNHSTKPQA